jgi:transposase
MSEELRKDVDGVTERGRSPSEVTNTEAAEGSPQGTGGEGEKNPEVPLPCPPPEEGRVAEAEGEETLDWEPPMGEGPQRAPPLCARRRGGPLRKKEEREQRQLKPEERLLVLDTWRRSGLPAEDFGALVGVPRHTLYSWKRRFEEHGPAGLMDRERGGPRGSKLPELTRRTILMLKESNPQWGCQRISDMLLRGPALPASASAVARVLHEAGYELEEVPTSPHPDKPREFERARPNELWQTDLFTFVLKRQNRRLYLVAFLDSCAVPGYVQFGVESQKVLGFRRRQLHITRFV